MSSEIITIYPPGALDRLSRAIFNYRKVSGRTSEDVLAKKGEDLAMRQPGGNSLHALFFAQSQRAGAITAAAKLRGFSLGRRRFGGSGVLRGISETAANRAQQFMGAFGRSMSILARVSEDGGRLNFSAVRRGIRGKRLRGRHVYAFGKRAQMSNRGRAGLAGDAVGGFETDIREKGDSRLNFRAVATIMEINLREAGRRFLSTGFLFQRFARIQQERVIQSVNPRSSISIEAEAALEGQAETGDITLRLTSHIPGTFEIGAARGLFAKALHFMTADMETYLANKQREALVAEMRGAIG